MAFSKELRDIEIANLYSDIDRNFRDPNHDYASCLPTKDYDHEKFLAGKIKQGMFESIYYEGVKEPLWVAQLTEDEAKRASDKAGFEVIWRTIRGHRRAVTVGNVNERFPGHIETVPAIVHTGLTLAEEWALLADHGGANVEEGLSELGQYRACVNLFATGQFSQEMIGRMLGETRGWAMRRIWIHTMGGKLTPTETEYLKRFDKDKFPEGTFFSFTYKDVEGLHTAFNADQNAKPKRKPMAEGSEFIKVWNTFAGTGSAKPKEPKALSRKTIDERDNFIAGRPALEEYARFASGRGGNAQDAAAMYDRIEEKANAFDATVTELEAAKARIVTLEAELADALATVTTLQAEISAVHAEATPAKGQGRKGR